jgi:hypothetical protein
LVINSIIRNCWVRKRYCEMGKKMIPDVIVVENTNQNCCAPICAYYYLNDFSEVAKCYKYGADVRHFRTTECLKEFGVKDDR